MNRPSPRTKDTLIASVLYLLSALFLIKESGNIEAAAAVSSWLLLPTGVAWLVGLGEKGLYRPYLSYR